MESTSQPRAASPFRWRLLGVLLFATLMAKTGMSLEAAVEVGVAGRWTAEGATGWTLYTPGSRQAAALLLDPRQRLAQSGGAGVLQVEFTGTDATTGLPTATVLERRPEAWVQPSIWQEFLRGPSLASGLGLGGRAGRREWAGRPATDRRGDELDPAWRRAPVNGLAGSTEPPPPVTPIRLALETGRGALKLVWPGRSGRRYLLESTPSLSEPFRPDGDPLTGNADADLSREVPLSGAQRYFRIVEQPASTTP